jgi:hypothetical protein
MKKLLSLLVVLMLMCSPAFAELISATTQIDSVVLSNTVTTASAILNVPAQYSALTFSVSYDETDGNSTLSVAVTLLVSMDGTIWSNASFYDYAGGATLQTSETISTDNLTVPYILWTNPQIAAPYYKILITPTGHDASHTAIIIVKSASKA